MQLEKIYNSIISIKLKLQTRMYKKKCTLQKYFFFKRISKKKKA